MDTKKQYGVYYTPENIAREMIEKTIYQYLSLEKVATNIDELLTEYKDKNKLDVLYNKLESLRIIEPACGDGAILLPLCEVLFDIHTRYIEYTCDTDKEAHYWQVFNSIYGVDIDEEAVNRCKLKLMYLFQIYIPSITLSDFDSKIIVGNSLISDSNVDPIAFEWEDKFSSVFKENGGFDICISNPPYVRQEYIKEIKPYLQDNYVSYFGTAGLHIYFFEKGIDVLKENGILTYISQRSWISTKYGEKLRRFLLNYYIEFVTDFHEKIVFDNANVNTFIMCIRKRNESNPYMLINDDYFLDEKYLTSEIFNFTKQDVYEVYHKVKDNHPTLKETPGIIHHLGTKSGCNNVFIISEELALSMINEDPLCAEIVKPCLNGKDIRKGFMNWSHNYIIYAYRGVDITRYPPVHKYLSANYDDIAPRKPGSSVGRSNYNNREWYELQSNITHHEVYEKTKLIYPTLADRMGCLYDDTGYYLTCTVGCVICDSEDLTLLLYAILNSTLMKIVIFFVTPILGDSFHLRKVYIDRLPIAIPKSDDLKRRINKISKEIIHGDYVYEHEILALQHELDSVIYELYGLNDAEISILESFMNSLETKKKKGY